MNIRSFLKAGHTPSLFCAFLYFDISFMVWVLVGALANSIVPEFGLNESQRGLMIALPLLGGAFIRIILGVMTDRMGAYKTGVIGLVLTVLPLLLGWLWVDSYEKMLVVGVMLGVAGASFAAALPLASRWYPPQYQGLARATAAQPSPRFSGRSWPRQSAGKMSSDWRLFRSCSRSSCSPCWPRTAPIGHRPRASRNTASS
jgi:MFS transporter, NNP family, nitrate/nitrite transporter